MECYAGAQEPWVALKPESLSESEPWGNVQRTATAVLGEKESFERREAESECCS